MGRFEEGKKRAKRMKWKEEFRVARLQSSKMQALARVIGSKVKVKVVDGRVHVGKWWWGGLIRMRLEVNSVLRGSCLAELFIDCTI